MLIRVLEVEKPTKLVVAFDTAQPSFRKTLYPAYKANRLAPPEDLIVQIPHIQRAVDAFQIYRVESPGYEADDVIGTVAKRATKDGFLVEVITGDKDLMQLVDGQVTLYDSMKEKRFDTKGVVEKFGVSPNQMVDFLALMGDSSDNVPGVKGVGEKTAAQLLQQFGSLDKIYKNLDKIKQDKRRTTLHSQKEVAYLSKKLVQIFCEVPLTFSWTDLSYRGPNLKKLEDLFTEFEFQNLLKRFDMKPKENTFSKGQYICIQTEKALCTAITELKKKPLLSVDTETTSLKIHDATVVGISLSGEFGRAFYVPIHHEDTRREGLVQLPEEMARRHLKEILEDEAIKKVGQNLKYDLQILKTLGVELKGIVSDTLVASYLLDPEKPHNLDSLAFRFLGHQNISYGDVTQQGKLSFAEVSIQDATQYSGEDADVTLRLHQKLFPELKKSGLLKLYEEVEVPLVSVLGEMEYRGVAVDEKRLRKMSTDLEKEIEAVQSEIFELAGGAFNINSPKQLSHILFDKLGLPILRRTKTGASTDERVLTELSDKHAVPNRIVKFRELGKLKSTYVDGLLAEIHPVTRRIHTHFNQTVTSTGRLSSSEPNLQNIPDNPDYKYTIRSVFIAPPGMELLAADYSQVELRILAHMSEDGELLRAFENNEDVHEVTARSIFGSNSVTAEQRKIAKTINFGVIYGQTPYGLSQQLRITPKDAKAFIDSYFNRYSGVKKFLQKVISQTTETGFVSTLLGRRRFIPEIHSENKMRREMAERTATNTPLQGTAADMIKVAMVRIFHRLKRENLKSTMILQVHDELVLEVPLAEKSHVEHLVRQEMEGALKLKCPLKVDLGWGKNWGETL